LGRDSNISPRAETSSSMSLAEYHQALSRFFKSIHWLKIDQINITYLDSRLRAMKIKILKEKNIERFYGISPSPASYPW
jgi:hypothetical protein